MFMSADARPQATRIPGSRQPADPVDGIRADTRQTGRERDSSVGAGEYGDIFLSIVEHTGIGLVVLDDRLRIQEYNPAFLDQCGTPLRDLTGRDFADLVHPSVRNRMLRHFERLIDGRDIRFVEHLAALWASQTEFTGSLNGMAVHAESGELKSVIVLVTPERAAEENRVLVSPNKILSPIDARILEGVATGASTVQLATKLYLSRQGIEYHVGNMLRHFKVPNRAALVSKAYSMGLFSLGSWPPQVLPEYVHH